jgi:hypothetical protein
VLFAGNGYWEDVPGPEGQQHAQVLVLNKPEASGGAWAMDWDFGVPSQGGDCTVTSPGICDNLAVATMSEQTFTTYADGTPIRNPLGMLFAGFWNTYEKGNDTQSVVGVRNDATATWSMIVIDTADSGPINIAQVRSLGSHVDTVTGVSMVFAGEQPSGLFPATIDETGTIAWGGAEELAGCAPGSNAVYTCTNLPKQWPGCLGAGPNCPTIPPDMLNAERVMAITEATDSSGHKAVYATMGYQIYKRTDGASPSWNLFWEIPAADTPHATSSGLRGLTAITNPSGAGEVLLTATEGSAPNIWRVDPNTGVGVAEIDMTDLTDQSWGCGYVCTVYQIDAYNNIPLIDGVRLIGQGTIYFNPSQPIPTGHTAFSLTSGGSVDTNAYYTIRTPPAAGQTSGTYQMYDIPPLAVHQMVSTRAIALSPFPGDNAIYFGGSDGNNTLQHNTAWVARAPLSVVIQK